MINFPTLEQQIVVEYGVVKGWIATHVYTAVGAAFALGWVLAKVI